MANYVQKGSVIDYKNSGASPIAAGDIVSLTTRIGVAGAEIPLGAIGTVAVTGVFAMPKVAEAVTLGAALYYDVAAGKITATANDNVPAGWAVAPAGVDDSLVLVKIG